MRLATILALAISAPVALAAAQPSALSNVTGGLWEISGAPGLRKPVQQCVSDVLALAQFEHRAQTCTRNVITDVRGDVLRIGFGVYQDEDDVDRLVGHLGEL